jgi:hypothetical protein
MPTYRGMQCVWKESHRLSRDPNLADRSYFDLITRENNGPLPQDMNEKVRSRNSQSLDQESPVAGGRKKGEQPIASAAAKWFNASGSRRFPWRRFNGDSRQSSEMPLNASIVILEFFAIP